MSIADQLFAVYGTPVARQQFDVDMTFIRGSIRIPVRATPLDHEDRRDSEAGVTQIVSDQDFEIHRDELILRGERIKPRDGDLLEGLIAGEIYTFQILPNDRSPSSEMADTDGMMLAVRTKRISVTRNA